MKCGTPEACTTKRAERWQGEGIVPVALVVVGERWWDRAVTWRVEWSESATAGIASGLGARARLCVDLSTSLSQRSGTRCRRTHTQSAISRSIRSLPWYTELLTIIARQTHAK